MTPYRRKQESTREIQKLLKEGGFMVLLVSIIGAIFIALTV